MSDATPALPLEDLLNAVSTQLERAQSALNFRSQTAGLNFAVKDFAMDMRAVIDIESAEVRVRPALPGEAGVSTLRIGFTTVTRPMLEEHAVEFEAEEPAIAEAVDGLSEEEARRLEWIGVRNLADMQKVKAKGGQHEMRRLSRLPSDRLKQALKVADQRVVNSVSGISLDPGQVQALDPAARHRLKITGRNLTRQGALRGVTVNGAPAEVLELRDDAVTIATPGPVLSGALSLDWEEGAPDTLAFDLHQEGRA
ncbi:hypothetical protein EI983_14100 [Roseovarius faecimaris]|uniref:Uncharacterized protein n=1 Tax=Roseovarius faecimaris TaxID=2494550 RepID=A0A6I6IU99_9RHOB|nr:hypothetical protein [Roseovarius faecimaris]QGX99331.1 hypothetical protein EI983_14100 [Roseovarius faecimaris]